MSLTAYIPRLDGIRHQLRQGAARLPDGEHYLDGGQQARRSVHWQHLLSADQSGLHRAGSNARQQAGAAVLAGAESGVQRQEHRCDGANVRPDYDLRPGASGE